MSNPWAQWLTLHDTALFQMSRKTGWDAFVNAAPRPDFPTLTLTEMADLSPEEAEDYGEARTVWNTNPPTVRTQQLASAYQVIDEVMTSNRRDADKLRGSVVIDAEPYLGKTTIATRYARDFHRRIYRRYGHTTAEGNQRLPVAFVPLNEGITLKGLNQKLLEFYGHPAARRGSRTELTALAIDCVASCDTRLIVIDELHFVDFAGRHGTEVSNHLKGLANELPVTFIYVGVGLRERRFFDEGLHGEETVLAQTSRRATRCPVVPFSTGTDAGARAWATLLATLEPHYKLARARPGMLTDHADLLHKRTQGRIGSLATLLERACARAITTGTEVLDADVLSSVRIDNAAEHLSHST
ncbi:ATP/GTP-binding protein [Serinicoccus sp. CUA-874]|uniref:TniB family NTP-binding protein n=1 Tax=Serinicoccus sp. CUA-874 TaxID=1517939 RepID=UPI00095E538E|nr:TniB family NTP-binding protein [Serinicoccus sp. CUA-874]OLT18049.1 ATP/GTP-binding protein [Serinicoccus sp. CUA-874]